MRPLLKRTTHLWMTFVSAIAMACTSTSRVASSRSSEPVSNPPGDLLHAPDSFAVGDHQAVFVDIEKIEAKMVVDLDQGIIDVDATVSFLQPAPGFPIVELVPTVASVSLDGAPQELELWTTVRPPSKGAELSLLKKSLGVGSHTMRLAYQLKEHKRRSVRLLASDRYRIIFEMDDLDKSGRKQGRTYLENYLPANLDYDHFEVHLTIETKAAAKEVVAFSNAEVLENRDGGANISLKFPSNFGSSSPFLEVGYADAYDVRELSYRSVNGRDIKLTVYGDSDSADFLLPQSEKLLLESLGAAESELGAFPYDTYLLRVHENATPMEFAGAALAGRDSIEHEVFHSYLGRGAFPAGGSAGWIDEAVATWRDDQYNHYDGKKPIEFKRDTETDISTSLINLEEDPVRLVQDSPYTRITNRRAYNHGKYLLGSLDRKLKGALKPLVLSFINDFRFKTYDTKTFLEYLNKGTVEDLESFFARYVYGRSDVAFRWPSVDSQI